MRRICINAFINAKLRTHRIAASPFFSLPFSAMHAHLISLWLQMLWLSNLSPPLFCALLRFALFFCSNTTSLPLSLSLSLFFSFGSLGARFERESKQFRWNCCRWPEKICVRNGRSTPEHDDSGLSSAPTYLDSLSLVNHDGRASLLVLLHIRILYPLAPPISARFRVVRKKSLFVRQDSTRLSRPI